MMPMREGVWLATDIYMPKTANGKVPIISVRTPYNFNFWDVRNGVPADMTTAPTAVKRGLDIEPPSDIAIEWPVRREKFGPTSASRGR